MTKEQAREDLRAASRALEEALWNFDDTVWDIKKENLFDEFPELYELVRVTGIRAVNMGYLIQEHIPGGGEKDETVLHDVRERRSGMQEQ